MPNLYRRNDIVDQRVLAALGRGRDHVRVYGEIAEFLGLPRRRVIKAVQNLRLDGWPIASSTEDGVWLTDARQDMEQTFEALRRRVRSQMFTVWAVRSTLRKMGNVPVDQLPLWEEL